MATGAYPFIDIAVLDQVRSRFAAGDALVVLSTDLDAVLWANGPGARLLGYRDVEAVVGNSAGLGAVARRQIAAIRGFPRIGDEKPVTVRLSSGLASRAVGIVASSLDLPDGAAAILIAVPSAGQGRDASAIAARAVSGFAGAGHFAAIVDADGNVLAASDGFARLGFRKSALLALVEESGGESDRLIKRPVEVASRRLPAGFARLTDEPAMHLLVVVDEPVESVETPAVAIVAPEPAAPEPAAVETEEEPVESEEAVEPVAPPADEAEEPAEVEIEPESEIEPEPESEIEPEPQPDETEDTQQPDEVVAGQAETPAEAEANRPPVVPREDGWYFNAETEGEPPRAAAEAEPAGEEPAGEASGGTGPVGEAASVEQAHVAPEPDLGSGPVRFVWKTDAEGRLSELSSGFADAVGMDSASLIGRSFTEVAGRLDIDPDGEIAGLLERRDTWSGRSVLWPVVGTDLRVPVDLAALPAYGRDRSFEGFRGFGVARMGDAVVDPEAKGLELAGDEPEGEEPRSEEPEVGEPVGGIAGGVEDASPEPRQDGKATEPPAAANDLRPSSDEADTEAPSEEPEPVSEERRQDEFRGEVPALQIQPAPSRRTADKIIRLAEHRQAATENGLSASERLAFREIADRLKANDRTPSEASGDDETLAAPEDETENAAPEAEAENLAPEAEAEPAEERPEPPAAAGVPIRTEGFLPSAFSVLDRSRGKAGVDTSILARLPVPVLILAGDVLHYANREFLRLSGYDSIGELARHGGLAELFAEPLPADGEGARQPLVLRSRSGKETEIDATLQSVPWAGGKALLLAVKPGGPARTRQDDANRAEIAATIANLRARVSEMSTILDTATDGIVLIGEEGRIRSINRSAEALFGFESDKIEGKPFTTLFAVESQRAAQDYLAGLSEPGVASVLNDGREVIGREAQGGFIPMFMTIGKLPGDGGFCAVLRDITQWKRAEEDLTKARRDAEHASSQKTEFLARVSHEIRTPLNAIIGFSELMIDGRFGVIDNERYRDYLRDINRSGKHVLDLVNDLLDISKIEAGEQELNYEAVSLNDLLSESVATMQPQANRNRVIIRSSLASGLPEVVADLKTFRQIALNLLSNAIRYTPAGGQVIVSTSYEKSGDVVMRIRDTGVGMTQGEIDQALKPFKQINSLNRTRGDGTGLGLPLTKAMVEANRARFTISSRPGEGTMAEVVVPSTRVLAD